MLDIVDVSAYIWAGHEMGFSSRFRYNGVPTGGLYHLFMEIYYAERQKNDLVLCFDSRTNRKMIMPRYKSGRVSSPEVRFQKEFAYKYLKQVIPNAFKVQGYEADDLAYTVVENELASYGSGIYLNTVDYDWCHSIDQYGLVELYPATSNICNVSFSNFEKVFSTPEVRVPFNSITAYKCLFGDDDLSSDLVFKCDAVDTITLFNAFINFAIDSKLSFKSKDTMLQFADLFSDMFTQKERDELSARIEVFYPRYCPDLPRVKLSDINKDALSMALSLAGLRKIAGMMGVKYYEDMGHEQEIVRQMYLEQHQTNKFRESVQRMEYTKDFNVGGFD